MAPLDLAVLLGSTQSDIAMANARNLHREREGQSELGTVAKLQLPDGKRKRPSQFTKEVKARPSGPSAAIWIAWPIGLRPFGVTTIAMEFTGVYWIPAFEILEARDFEVLLVRTREVKDVPGWKTDLNDPHWLHQHGAHACLRPRDGVVRFTSRLATSSAPQTYTSFMPSSQVCLPRTPRGVPLRTLFRLGSDDPWGAHRRFPAGARRCPP